MRRVCGHCSLTTILDELIAYHCVLTRTMLVGGSRSSSRTSISTVLSSGSTNHSSSGSSSNSSGNSSNGTSTLGTAVISPTSSAGGGGGAGSATGALTDPVKLLVLGASGVGKSALCVRYLTRRYIGDYSSNGDMNYNHVVTLDGIRTELHILDSCRCLATGCLLAHMRWADAFLVVYSVCDRSSFQAARGYLETLGREKLPGFYSFVLLGNKRDLEHARQVDTEDGHELSLEHGCPFYEVSAAESVTGVSLAVQTLLKEWRSLQLLRALPVRRRSGVHSVSKVLGNIFGKNGRYRKKRPSLSI